MYIVSFSITQKSLWRIRNFYDRITIVCYIHRITTCRVCGGGIMQFPGLSTADIYLPEKGTDLMKWAVVACDQYTSEPSYWEDAKKLIGGEPSTLFLIQPEAFLKNACPEKINQEMNRYMEEGILEKAVEDGFVLVERTTESGVRLGLMAALDLENYDYTTGQLLTRATEDTVPDRLPPRVKIREHAPLELPHVMVLIDDPGKTVVEPLYESAKSGNCCQLLYDTELMKNGGHLRGWKVEEEGLLSDLSKALWKLEEVSGGFLYAVGDGNHSLATAKKCWENLKPSLSGEEKKSHPSRYALVEIENLHQDSLIFEPIHRVVFGVSQSGLTEAFRKALAAEGMELTETDRETADLFFTDGTAVVSYRVSGRGERLPVDVLQRFLDAWLAENPEAGIDYIHGDETVKKLAAEGNNTGILLKSIPKDTFFSGIRAGGHLPRKTFSMGHAHEKRFYMECRKIR